MVSVSFGPCGTFVAMNFSYQTTFLKHFLLGEKDQWRLMAFNARRHP